MENLALKRQMLEKYLQQQQASEQNISAPSIISEQDNTNIVLYNDLPENISMADFKNLIKKWMEYDNFIKKARALIKEKRKSQNKLSEIITKFMHRHNIEDINTKDGRIRCKTTIIKAPVNQKIVKQRISDYFKENEHQKNDILHKIYEDREEVQKVSLRRLKIS